jgi:hypothetical protein
MAEEIKQWEYRVQTIGSAFGTKDENIEETLNEWGDEGWEAINVYTPSGIWLLQGCLTKGKKRILLGKIASVNKQKSRGGS